MIINLAGKLPRLNEPLDVKGEPKEQKYLEKLSITLTYKLKEPKKKTFN